MRNKWMVGLCCALSASLALGQHSEDNEGLNATPEGTDLNGQSGYYNPVNPGSVTAKVYTYTDNGLGFPANPNGGDKFVGGTGPGGSVFVRSQKDITFGDGTGVWRVSFDIAAKFIGNLPAAQNLGSFSTQTFPGDQTFIALARWTDPNTAEKWNCDVVWFNNVNGQLTEIIPDANFQGLAVNHWYRESWTFDLDSHKFLEVSITDLSTGVTHTYEPVDRYLYGGQNGAPAPDGFRYFAGSANPAGNTLAFDNLVIEEVSEGPFCNYTLKKSKGKKCDSCPAKGSNVATEEVCEVVKDCTKKYKETIACPGGGDGKCKLKGKRTSCE
ncbi:MAG: hypothetical protein C4547_02250 [Phycisphaerales bacterium]|nr:MAG: hypothetical protein C4547_02250 [Phycisphaerales bacterium]